MPAQMQPKEQAQDDKVQQNLALLEKRTVGAVQETIEALTASGELQLPPDYSAPNALKSAWLKLQSTMDKDGKPVLMTCHQRSVINALMDMVVQGLTPAKNQAYFIPYGQELTCQRSYFGTMALTQRSDKDIAEFRSAVVYEGDDFQYHIANGRAGIDHHGQSLGNRDPEKIVGAYAVAHYSDGRQPRAEIMTLSESHRSWKQSRAKPFNGDTLKLDSTHAKFPADMAMRTVLAKLCKPILNASNDSYLFQQALHRSEDIATDADVEADIEEHANTETIDGEVVGAPADDAQTPQDAPETTGEGDALFTGPQRKRTAQAPF